MSAIRGRIPYFLLALVVVLVDQLLQVWLLGVLQPSEARMPDFFCHPLLRFNPDFAWGLLSRSFDWLMAVAIGLQVTMAACFLWLLLRTRGVVACALALLLGAMVNGAVDRLRYGAVVDFLVCQGGGWAPTFNVGDVVAFVGGALLVGGALTKAVNRRRINMDNIPRDERGTV